LAQVSTSLNPNHAEYQSNYDKLHDPKTGLEAEIKNDNAQLRTATKALTAAIKEQTKAVKASDAIPNSKQFSSDIDLLNANLARDDEANDDPLGNLTGAERGDIGSLIARYNNRIATLNALYPKSNKTRKDAINQELASDYSTLKSFQDQLNAPLNTPDAVASANGDSGSTDDSSGGISSDQQAQLDQLNQIGYNTLRANALANYAQAALGGASGLNLTVNTLHPGDPGTLQAIGTIVTSALDRQPAIGSNRQSILI
jgi:hypothetical protein